MCNNTKKNLSFYEIIKLNYFIVINFYIFIILFGVKFIYFNNIQIKAPKYVFILI
jgi:hypothetical protein